MIAILSLLVVVQLSLMVMRGAAVALEATGLDRDVARFQARSAFTGAGFTTGESEHVIRHRTRRRIVMWLMLVGNVGFISATSALLLSLVDIRSSTAMWSTAGLLGGGLVVLCLLETNKTVDRVMCRILGRVLRSSIAQETARRDLLELGEGSWVAEIRVRAGSWLAGLSLARAALGREGLLVLGLQIEGEPYLDQPESDRPLQPGDRLTLYGRGDRIAALNHRPAGESGNQAHATAAGTTGRA